MDRIKWVFREHDPDRVRELEQVANVPSVVAQILAARNSIELDQVASFLQAPLNDLRPPDQLHDVPGAAKLIASFVRQKKTIGIFGDYDADGMTGTAILFRCLKAIGGDVKYFVPNRLTDGYGLNHRGIDQFHQDGVELMISVDCGIASLDEVVYAKSLGLSVVVTDHHTMKERLPEADAVVHPQHPDKPYPFAGLCGAGVAFKLAWAICQEHCGDQRVPPELKSFLMAAVGLAAIGTIADVVPLLDENRVIVKNGLNNLTSFPVPGIQQLIRLTGNDRKKALDTDDIGFSIGPRLNASGRLGQAQLGVELLTTDQAKRSQDLAEYIHNLNDSRESLERGILKAARQQIKDEHLDEEPALVLAGRGWHPGVIGIVAGRIAEKYHRPTVVIALDQMKTKPGMGSARTALGLDLYSAIEKCSDLLESFGGHPAAAGLKINEENLDQFRDELCRVIAEDHSISEIEPELLIDCEVPLSHLTMTTMNQFQQLAPFGQDHPRPLLAATQVEFKNPARMGKGDLHFKTQVTQYGINLRAVAFGKGDWLEEIQQNPGPYDVAFRPVINEFNGFRSVEMHLVDWKVSELAAIESVS